MPHFTGGVRAEGQVVTTTPSTSYVQVQVLDSVSGQRSPRQITVGDLLAGGGTSFTEGSIIFADSTGSLAEDNTNLFWNDSTNTARITNMTIGTSGTLGSFKVYQGTASKGYLALVAVANTGDTATTISNAAMGQASVISIPDPGASTANFVLDKAAQSIGGAKTFTSDITATTANIIVGTAGKGFQIKEGSNARMGVSTLTAGTVTVSNTSVTANTRIIYSRYSPGASTALGTLSIGTVVASTSFVINSLKPADATVETNDISVIHWELIEPAA